MLTGAPSHHLVLLALGADEVEDDIGANPSSVVLNASNSAHKGFATASAYAATKAALAFLPVPRTTRPRRAGERHQPRRYRHPLYTKQGIPAERADEAMRRIRANIPLGRFDTTHEVAKAVIFLASDESAFTLGADFIIDGGGTTL